MLSCALRNRGKLCYTKLAALSARRFSDLSINVDNDTKVAVVSLNKKPVNSLSLETLSELSTAITQLEADKHCKGLILTSGVPRVFSAGLDILEMYQPKEERLRHFWRTLQDVWLALYGTNLSTIAAVNGNSPAGGCLLAMSCDYRIMAEGKYSIGLNETKLGIVAPFWFQATMERLMGPRETEKALMLGHMYSAQEAHAKGLVDQLVPEDQVISQARAEMQRWLTIPDAARAMSKTQLRGSTLEKLQSQREDDIQNFVDFTLSPGVQKGLGMYMEMLKQRGAKK